MLSAVYLADFTDHRSFDLYNKRSKTMIKLIADTINGVQEHDFDPDKYDVLGNEDFLLALKDCQPDEVLYGVVTKKIFQQIAQQYGVNR